MGKANIYYFSRPAFLPQEMTSAIKIYIVYLVVLNGVCLPDLNFTDVANNFCG